MAGDVPSSFALLRKMEDEMIEPNTIVRTMLIDAVVNCGRPRYRRKLGKHIKALNGHADIGVPRDFISSKTTSLHNTPMGEDQKQDCPIAMRSSSSYLDLAWELFWSWRTWKKFEPDSVTFTVMIKACRLRMETERALSTFDDMQLSGCMPTDETYTEMIRSVSADKFHAEKAFHYFAHLRAEEMPITRHVCIGLLTAVSTLGNIRKLAKVLAIIEKYDMGGYKWGNSNKIHVLCLRTFANAMLLEGTTDFERLSHLRCAWNVVNIALSKSPSSITSSILDEVTAVYAKGGYAAHAIDTTAQYAKFGVEPTIKTFHIILNMLSGGIQDYDRFFAVYDLMIETFSKKVSNSSTLSSSENRSSTEKGVHIQFPPVISNEVLHLALDTAMDSRSSSRTVAVLNHMIEKGGVMPLPRQAERLARVGKKIIQIHESISKLMRSEKQGIHDAVDSSYKKTKLEIENYKHALAMKGKTIHQSSVEDRCKKIYFTRMEKRGLIGKRRPRLPWNEYISLRMRGGGTYAKKVDRPVPNILAGGI